MGAKDQIFIGNMIANNRNQNISEGCFYLVRNAAFFNIHQGMELMSREYLKLELQCNRQRFRI